MTGKISAEEMQRFIDERCTHHLRTNGHPDVAPLVVHQETYPDIVERLAEIQETHLLTAPELMVQLLDTVAAILHTHNEFAFTPDKPAIAAQILKAQLEVYQAIDDFGYGPEREASFDA